MGSGGDATPYPEYIDARLLGPVQRDLGIMEMAEAPEGLQLFNAYSYDAVHKILGDPRSALPAMRR